MGRDPRPLPRGSPAFNGGCDLNNRAFDDRRSCRYPHVVVDHLLRKGLAQYRLDVNGVHGIRHWGRVLENGRRLAALTGADVRVVEHFAIFHDACRLSDGEDCDHGPRAAELVRGLRGEIDLDDEAFALLVLACECHTKGPRFPCDETVLACLDADRLDIPRVGFRIRKGLLFTTAARDSAIVEWAGGRAWHDEVPAVIAEEWATQPSRPAGPRGRG